MWRISKRATSGLAALLLLGAVGCVDLEVKNMNDPDAERALATPGDVESLIAGGFQAWYGCMYYDGPTMWISNASGEHVAPWGNSGMEMYARIPRIPTDNLAGAANVGTLSQCWYRSYRAIAAIADGLRQIESGAVDLGADGNLRARAYGRLIQGLSHATIAVMYDSGFVFDETIDASTVVLQDYPTVMDAALGYLADAAALAGSGTFTVPTTWMSWEVPSATIARLAHSWAASFRANVARTPAERAAVDWNAVVADVNAGLTEDWEVYGNISLGTFSDDAMRYRAGFAFWHMQNNWLSGMADQSGNYQSWIGTAMLDKQPFIIVTPDTRWPQGPDEATQLANPGENFEVNQGDSRIWNRPDRGTWRWSYYQQIIEPFYTWTNVTLEEFLPMTTVREMRALAAEANYRAGNMAAVATFVNETRTLHGLNATDAAGTNTSCVPKLPNNNCGDLWEMFKWEKRWETQFRGPLRSGFWFDGRGWGDLMAGTILQLPVPYAEMQLLGQQPYNYGGVGGNFAAPVGTYGY
jgi:hypothetical protein